MTTRTVTKHETKPALTRSGWGKVALTAAVSSVLAVLAVQAAALAVWPELVRFKPLDSAPRAALFTLIPALGATAVFAWLVQHRPQPVKQFVILALVVLLVSVIPDYALPLQGKTPLGSTVAAFMHLTAGVVTVAAILASYRQQAGQA